MRFYDEAKIHIKSGDGGAGMIHFRREKYAPKGGPDGGDGGRGGHVILKASQKHSLLDYHHKRKYMAKDGVSGGINTRTGADGGDLILEVPVGTLVYEWDDQKRMKKRKLADLTELGQKVVLAKGGRGGHGNTFFKGPVRQAPKMAQPGEKGQHYGLYLELRLLADVGLVGFPNAGKSSLLRVVSNATPKVANYPFTTLAPHLGVVRIHDHDVVMSDLPGLIEGAAKGVGLGHRFLKHVERTRCLLFILNCDPMAEHHPRIQYTLLKQEISQYNAELLSKSSIVVLNKSDLFDQQQKEAFLESFNEAGLSNDSICFMSTVTKDGIKELLEVVYKMISNS